MAIHARGNAQRIVNLIVMYTVKILVRKHVQPHVKVIVLRHVI